MQVRLRSELVGLIKQDIARGAYSSVDDFVDHAVSMLHEQEVQLAANRFEIEAKIAEGYAAAQRGELLDPKQVRSRLAELKRARSALLGGAALSALR